MGMTIPEPVKSKPGQNSILINGYAADSTTISSSKHTPYKNIQGESKDTGKLMEEPIIQIRKYSTSVKVCIINSAAC